MSDSFSNHKLTAILYADVVGYSRLTSRDEMGTHKRVTDLLDFASESIGKAGGTVLRYVGDAILEAALQHALGKQPGLTISFVEKALSITHQKSRELFLGGLAKAGVPDPR